MTRAKPQEKKSLTLRIGEYMAGTTVEEFAKWKYKNSSKQKKSGASRDVVKLEITTDDETEADTLKLTYPRSGRSISPATAKAKAAPKSTPAPAIESDSESESASVSESDATVKKVRFETVTKPRKSALKKKTRKLKSDSSSHNTSSNSNSSEVSYSSDASSSESSLSTNKKDKKKKKSNPSTPEASSEDTDAELKVECNCPKCKRKRMKLRLKNKKAQESDSEASQSEAEIPPMAKRPKQPNKAKKKSPSAGIDSGEEPSSSAPDTETETETETETDTGTGTGSETKTPSEAKEQKSAKNKNVKTNKQQMKLARQPNGGAKKEAKGEKVQDDKVKDKAKDEKQETREAAKKSNYPEAAMPSSHARRPNLTEPIRAEVVQMERVIEGPEDPYPNAYYDAEHGIMRYYQGPVYGSRGSQPLYPKRDPDLKPLPIGVPHPSRNSYYNGFKEQDASRVPYGQGAGPAYMPAGYPPPPHGYGPPYHAVDHGADMENSHKKSNYVMSGANGKASFGERDGAGDDNGPKLGQNNPYYNNRRSRFSMYGSNISASGQSRKAGGGQHRSPIRSHNTWGWIGSQNYPPPPSPMRDNWATGSKHGSQRGGGADKPPSHSEWDADQNKTQAPSGYVSAWDATANSDHGNNNKAPGRTSSNDSWGQAQPTGGNRTWSSSAKGAASPQFDNVGQAMPGSWMPDTQYTSTWGDNTMAASTGGAVDQPGGEWDSKPTEPVW